MLTGCRLTLACLSQVSNLIKALPLEYPRHLEWSYRWEGDAAWVGECINDETNNENKFAARLSGPLSSLRVMWDGCSPHLLWCITNALRKMDAAPDAAPLVLVIVLCGDMGDLMFEARWSERWGMEFARVAADAMLEHLVRELQFEGIRDLGELVLVVHEDGDDWGWLVKTGRACEEWGVSLQVVTSEQLTLHRPPAWVTEEEDIE